MADQDVKQSMTGRTFREPSFQNVPLRTELGRQLRKTFSSTTGIFNDVDFSELEDRLAAAAETGQTGAIPMADQIPEVKPTVSLKEGGTWLGAVRNWIKWNKRNGSQVVWGSNNPLTPPMTVRELEEAAECAVNAQLAEVVEPLLKKIATLTAERDAAQAELVLIAAILRGERGL